MNKPNTKLSEIQSLLGYNFNNLTLLKLALTPPSLGKKNNQRLEFLGDSVLGLAVSDCLYFCMTDADEGILSRIKSFLVSRKVLIQIAYELKLSETLRSLSIDFSTNKKILADVVEAIIGAIYEDGGWFCAKEFIIRFWTPIIERIQIEDIIGPKEQLQILVQSKGKQLDYRLIDERGPSHKRVFKMAVYIDGVLFGEGKGKTKKEAQKNAAKSALIKLNRKGGCNEKRKTKVTS